MKEYFPSRVHNPIGLLLRLIRKRDPAAIFALKCSFFGPLLIPIDQIFKIYERKLYKRAPWSKQPLIIVVGPPRSGTTIVAQFLIKYLPVCYINNLTSLFPRSPLTANMLFKKWISKRKILLNSFYGKSRYLSGPNDGLYIWDRWLMRDSADENKVMDEKAKNDLCRFFSAYMFAHKKPLICKNNSLNVRAHLVAEAYKNSYFICLTRDPIFLAQSLFKARLDIHGSLKIPYGIDDPNKSEEAFDPIEDVCRQVIYHQKKMNEQQRIIGKGRYWIITYEEFCKDPMKLIEKVSEKIFNKRIQNQEILKSIKPIEIANKVKIDKELFKQIKHIYQKL